jgi:hypothetical protein
MRNAMRTIALFGALAVPTGLLARGPGQPIACPPDIAAAVAAACPCDGQPLPSGGVQPWRNHGRYVSCVVRLRNALRKGRCFTDDSQRRTLARCAARSTCGKSGAVLCCLPTGVARSRSEARCAASGGTSAGAGSVCSATCSPSGAFLDRIAF